MTFSTDIHGPKLIFPDDFGLFFVLISSSYYYYIVTAVKTHRGDACDALVLCHLVLNIIFTKNSSEQLVNAIF